MLSEWLFNSSGKKPLKADQIDISSISKSLMTDVRKIKILSVFTIILEEKFKIHILMHYKAAFDHLKYSNQLMNMNKFGFLKLMSFLNRRQKDLKKDFFLVFTEMFAKKFKNYMKGILNIRKPNNSSVSKSKPSSSPKLSILISKMLKMTRDIINDSKAEDFKISFKDLNLLIMLQRGVNLLSFFYQYQRKKSLQNAFRTLLKRTVQSIPEDDITGVKDFSHYSIILHPVLNEKSNKPKTKLLRTPNRLNKSHVDNVLNFSQSNSPIPVHMLSQQIVRVGEISSHDLSSYYESSINVSPERRIEKFHNKLKNLSLILNKKMPSMKSKHLHKFLQYDQALFQVFRISENSRLREKLIVFQKIENFVARKKTLEKILNNLLNLAKRFKSNLMLKNFLKWQNDSNKVENMSMPINISESEEIKNKKEKRKNLNKEFRVITLIFKRKVWNSFEILRNYTYLKRFLEANGEIQDKWRISNVLQILKNIFLRRVAYGLRRFYLHSIVKAPKKQIKSLILLITLSLHKRMASVFHDIKDFTSDFKYKSIRFHEKFSSFNFKITRKTVSNLIKIMRHQKLLTNIKQRQNFVVLSLVKIFNHYHKFVKGHIMNIFKRLISRKKTNIKPLAILINSFLRTRNMQIFEKFKTALYRPYRNSFSEGLSLLQKILGNKEKLLMKDAFFNMIIHEHKEAFENQGKFLRFLKVFKKAYLLKLFYGFSALKVHLNMGYLEFFISKRLFSQEKLERENYIETLIEKIEKQNLSETQIINVLRGNFEKEELDKNFGRKGENKKILRNKQKKSDIEQENPANNSENFTNDYDLSGSKQNSKADKVLRKNQINENDNYNIEFDSKEKLNENKNSKEISNRQNNLKNNEIKQKNKNKIHPTKEELPQIINPEEETHNYSESSDSQLEIKNMPSDQKKLEKGVLINANNENQNNNKSKPLKDLELSIKNENPISKNFTTPNKFIKDNKMNKSVEDTKIMKIKTLEKLNLENEENENENTPKYFENNELLDKQIDNYKKIEHNNSINEVQNNETNKEIHENKDGFDDAESNNGDNFEKDDSNQFDKDVKNNGNVYNLEDDDQEYYINNQNADNLDSENENSIKNNNNHEKNIEENSNTYIESYNNLLFNEERPKNENENLSKHSFILENKNLADYYQEKPQISSENLFLNQPIIKNNKRSSQNEKILAPTETTKDNSFKINSSIPQNEEEKFLDEEDTLNNRRGNDKTNRNLNSKPNPKKTSLQNDNPTNLNDKIKENEKNPINKQIDNSLQNDFQIPQNENNHDNLKRNQNLKKSLKKSNTQVQSKEALLIESNEQVKYQAEKKSLDKIEAPKNLEESFSNHRQEQPLFISKISSESLLSPSFIPNSYVSKKPQQKSDKNNTPIDPKFEQSKNNQEPNLQKTNNFDEDYFEDSKNKNKPNKSLQTNRNCNDNNKKEDSTPKNSNFDEDFLEGSKNKNRPDTTLQSNRNPTDLNDQYYNPTQKNSQKSIIVSNLTSHNLLPEGEENLPYSKNMKSSSEMPSNSLKSLKSPTQITHKPSNRVEKPSSKEDLEFNNDKMQKTMDLPRSTSYTGSNYENVRDNNKYRIRTENTENADISDVDEAPMNRATEFENRGEHDYFSEKPEIFKKNKGDRVDLKEIESQSMIINALENANHKDIDNHKEILSLTLTDRNIELGEHVDDPGIKGYFEYVCPENMTNISRKFSDKSHFELNQPFQENFNNDSQLKYQDIKRDSNPNYEQIKLESNPNEKNKPKQNILSQPKREEINSTQPKKNDNKAENYEHKINPNNDDKLKKKIIPMEESYINYNTNKNNTDKPNSHTNNYQNDIIYESKSKPFSNKETKQKFNEDPNSNREKNNESGLTQLQISEDTFNKVSHFLVSEIEKLHPSDLQQQNYQPMSSIIQKQTQPNRLYPQPLPDTFHVEKNAIKTTADSKVKPFETIQEEEYFQSNTISEKESSFPPTNRQVYDKMPQKPLVYSEDSNRNSFTIKSNPNNYQSAYQNLFYENSQTQNRLYKHNSYNKPIVPSDYQATKDQSIFQDQNDEFRDNIPCRSLRPLVYEQDDEQPLQKFREGLDRRNKKDFGEKLNRSEIFDRQEGSKKFVQRKDSIAKENRGVFTEKGKKKELDELFDEILEQRFESLKKQRPFSKDYPLIYKGQNEIREESHEENCLNCEFCGNYYVQDESFYRNMLDTTDLAIPQKTLNAELLSYDDEDQPDRTLNVDFLE